MSDARELWEESFRQQIAERAFNTAPVEALVRSVSYYLRERYPGDAVRGLHFLEMGCGAGPNLSWLAERGMRVSGVDIAPNALALARERLAREGHQGQIATLLEGSVTATPFGDASFDGIIEACVFQHLDREDRRRAFAEVARLLRPGGLFVGYLLDAGHSTYVKRQAEELAHDPGTLMLQDGGAKFHLTNIGLSHFFRRQELIDLLPGFAVVDPCLTLYDLPREEARRRGYEEYRQSMWTLYAIK